MEFNKEEKWQRLSFVQGGQFVQRSHDIDIIQLIVEETIVHFMKSRDG